MSDEWATGLRPDAPPTGLEPGDGPGFETVSETMFLPLYALAIESKRPDPIIRDMRAVELTDRINEQYRDSPSRLFARLRNGRLPGALVVTLSLRIRRYDEYVRTFLDRVPDGVVVNLACGLDLRRHRVDNGRMRWFDLDLPPVIAFRRLYLEETERMRFVASSVTDPAWMEALPHEPGERFLILAEGLFMYLPGEEVAAVVRTLMERYPGAEMVCEVANRKIVSLMHTRWGRGKFRRQFGLSEDVVYQSGLSPGEDMAAWAPGITVLEEWTYFDSNEPRLGWIRWFTRWDLFRRVQWTLHLRLGP